MSLNTRNLRDVQIALDTAAEHKMTAEVVLSMISAARRTPNAPIVELVAEALEEWDLL